MGFARTLLNILQTIRQDLGTQERLTCIVYIIYWAMLTEGWGTIVETNLIIKFSEVQDKLQAIADKIGYDGYIQVLPELRSAVVVIDKAISEVERPSSDLSEHDVDEVVDDVHNRPSTMG